MHIHMAMVLIRPCAVLSTFCEVEFMFRKE